MTQVTNLYLARHGQTEWNVEHRLQGFKDSPLTELGIEQAKWLGDAFEDTPLDLIYSSSSHRAYRTAELIRKNKAINIIQTDALKEIHMGDWEGLTQTEAKEAYPEQFDLFWNDPSKYQIASGETFFDVYNRAIPKLTDIIAANLGKNILIVSHTIVVKLIMAYFEKRALSELWNPPFIHPVCLSHIQIIDDQPTIILHGDTSHYKVSQ